MKKTLFFILMILVLIVSSCNLFLKEEYGELILSFDGSLPEGARALDSNGLPVLSSSPMKIDIIREDGYTVTRELSAEEPKSLVELIPVGEKIKIIVTAINPSAQWSGRVSHTVTSGQNHVRVLLNKKISGLNNLLFTQTKTIDFSGSTIYSLVLDIGGKNFQTYNSFDKHSFVRDSKGRLCVRYKDTDFKFARYTSEGNLITPIGGTFASNIEFLANDYTTGKLYGFKKNGTNYDVYEIDENLSPHPTTTTPIHSSNTGPFAVDNGIFTWGNLNSSVIYLWKAGTGATTLPNGNFSHQAGEYCLTHNDGFTVTDIFIRGGYVYLLLAGVSETDTRGLYSLGAVLKWKIGTNPASSYPRFEGTPVVLGKSAGSPVIENGVLKNYDYSKNFYGAVKIIGFDEENLYIADDGFDAAYVDYAPHIVKNRNRIAALNMETNEVRFTEADSAKWYDERSEWKGLDTKIVVWKDSPPPPSLDYYQLENADALLPASAPALAQSMTDIFTYDRAGNLYIYNDGLTKEIRKFKLKDDGSYDPASENLTITLASGEELKAFAVDTSTKSLYYNVENTSFDWTVKKMTWTGGFASATSVLGYSISADTSSGGESFNAIAANEDGLFVAVRTTSNHPAPADKTYGIEVRKYSHTDSSAPKKTIQLVSDKPLYQAIQGTDTGTIGKKRVDEIVRALHIKNGILYALTTENTGENSDGSCPSFSYITGKLLQIGSDTRSFAEFSSGQGVKKLYGFDIADITSATSGDFAPYRFIAVKPKKLVIASTGYVTLNPTPSGSTGPTSYKRKIYEYDLETAAMSNGVAQDGAIFYKEANNSGYGWD